VVLRDFNFEKPNLNLEATFAGEQGDRTLDFSAFPGEYKEQKVGETLAQVRLEELRADQKVGAGAGVCRRLIPGFRFSQFDHPCSEFNREYLITRLVHSGRQPQDPAEDLVQGESLYENQFECIPSDIPYRPPRVTPKPKMEGMQTAIVVGPDGEEIYTDEHGRIKVRFHWDRNDRVLEGQDNTDVEKSSCWMRVSQLWAGPSWGAMFIPRIGQEVLVDFLEGDPDRPIVVGRVYHGENQPPYPLPDEKTKSTIKSNSSKGGDGSNEIRFEDTKGSEEFYTHAQKDQNEVIENNMSTSVGADQSLTVGGNRTVTIQGSENITINGKAESGGVTGGSLGITGDYKVDASNTIEIQAPTHIKLTCGGSSIMMEPGKITITAGGNAKIVLDANALMQSSAGSKVFLDGNAEMKSSGGSSVKLDGNAKMDTPGSATVSAAAKSEVTAPTSTLAGAAGKVEASAAGVDIAGPKITSAAQAVNEITGATVKLN
jgi:type VI secretion system secreted protein VgrG